MRSVFRSSPPGAPRSIVTALSRPRPAYRAAHRPAGPAPTMMTSNVRASGLVMCFEFQSRGISLPREGARQLRAKVDGFEFDLGPLRTGQLFEGCRSNDDHAVPVPARAMQQRGGGLNQSLPHAGFVFLNNRTPDCFQRFVRQPVVALIEQLPSVRQGAVTVVGSHGRTVGRPDSSP